MYGKCIMSSMQQTALTRYYSAKKQGSALKNQEIGLFGKSVDILQTPKGVNQALISGSSEPCSTLPRKKRRMDAAEKTPVNSNRGDCLPSRRPPPSVRKRLLLHEDAEKTNLPSLAGETAAEPVSKEASKMPVTLSPSQQMPDVAKLKGAIAMKRLASPGKLQELQARLTAIDKAQAAIGKVQKAQPHSSRDKVGEDPAYVRFHHLAEPQTPSLTLPYSYKELAETFRCCDIIVSMLFNRKEVCTFDKLKRSVEEMSKKSFNKTKLGQIKAVFPDAYILTQERLQQRSLSGSGYQLVVTPKLPPEEPKMLTAAQLLHRRKRFHALLLSSVKEHHHKFLLNLSPPVNIASSAITRWHPKFPLDSVPAISSASLPESPMKKSCSTAQDVLDKVKGRLGERIEKALLSLSADQRVAATASPSRQAEEVGNTCLKGISEDLLARIRARESFKLVKEMTLRPEDEKERAELTKLPEFIRITRSLFLAEQKAAIPKDDFVQKIRESFSSIQAVSEIESLVALASKVLPDWFKVLTIRRGMFVKIVKETDINDLIARITKKLQQ